MGIDEIKRWQWVLLSVLVGLGLGWAWSSQEPGSDGKLINQIDFERELVMKHPKTGEALIKDIVLDPITKDYRNRDVQPVTFQRLQQGAKTGRTIYQPATYIAQIPYVPMMNGPRPAKANLSLTDYLANAQKKTHPEINFRYGWYNDRPAAMLLWTLSCIVLIGGIWPTLLNLLVGAGMGTPAEKKKKDKKKKEDYFERFTSGPDPAMNTGQVAKVVTDADRDRLEDMNVSLERELAGNVVENSPATATGPQTDAEVRQLQGGPLEVAPISATGEQDEIEIKGEYYPVLIHHKKTHEEDESGDQSAGPENDAKP